MADLTKITAWANQIGSLSKQIVTECGTAPTPVSPVPLAYTATTSRSAWTKPTLPTLGPAGYHFNDPRFDSRMQRVTDRLMRPDAPDRSWLLPSSAHQSAWSSDSLRFFLMANDGGSHLFRFDPVTMSAAKQNAGKSDGDLPSIVAPQFSLLSPTVVFGAGGANGHTVMQFDADSLAGHPLFDLESLGYALENTYVGGVMSTKRLGNPSAEQLLVFFGGNIQDAHHRAVVLGADGHVLAQIDTLARLGMHLHACSGDKSGRYVSLFPSNADHAANPALAHDYIWDLQTDVITPLTDAMHPYGHDTFGYEVRVNQDCCTACAWDGGQWQFRNLATPAATKDLIVPVLTPKVQYIADHPSWHNAQPGRNVPIFSATYVWRPDLDTIPRAWNDEVIAIETATPGAAARVWRFCHHRSDVRSDVRPDAQYFGYEPMINVAPNGRVALFHSNWEKQLGRDSLEPVFRTDAFLVEAKGA
jgi:hypothetical protein